MSKYRPVKLAFKKIEPDGEINTSQSPVIFLHGLLLFKEYWEEVPNAIAKATKRTAYIVDFRNHGESEWSEEYDFDLHVKDLLHFMDTLKIPKAILVGHSMGGFVAIKTALAEPDRVEKLVGEDIGVSKFSEARKMTAFVISLARKACEETPIELNETEARRFILKYIADKLPEHIKKLHDPPKKPGENPNLIMIKRRKDGHWTYKANLEVIERVMKSDQEFWSDYEGAYKGPACFIYGTVSPLNIGDELDEIRKFFPGAEFVAVEGAAHGVHTDRPKEFIEALTKFLCRT